MIPKLVMDRAIDIVLWRQMNKLGPLSLFDKQYIKWFYSQKEEIDPCKRCCGKEGDLVAENR